MVLPSLSIPKQTTGQARNFMSFLKIFRLQLYTQSCFSLFVYHYLDSSIKLCYKILKLFFSLDLFHFYFLNRGMKCRDFRNQESKVKVWVGQHGGVCWTREDMPHIKQFHFVPDKIRSLATNCLKLCFIILLSKLTMQFKEKIRIYKMNCGGDRNMIRETLN